MRATSGIRTIHGGKTELFRSSRSSSKTRGRMRPSTVTCQGWEPLIIHLAPSLLKFWPLLLDQIPPSSQLATSPYLNSLFLARAKRTKSTEENYQLALSDLSTCNIKAELVTLEIGCLGHHTNDLFCALKHIAPSSCRNKRYELRDLLSKSVITSSHTIFRAHCSSGPLLLLTVTTVIIISFIFYSHSFHCLVSRASLYPDFTPESEADFCIHCYTWSNNECSPLGSTTRPRVALSCWGHIFQFCDTPCPLRSGFSPAGTPV